MSRGARRPSCPRRCRTRRRRTPRYDLPRACAKRTWPRFCVLPKRLCASRVYQSGVRTLAGMPRIRRRDLNQAPPLTWCPNRSGCSRGLSACMLTLHTRRPSSRAARVITRQTVDEALAEIDSPAGRHLYFLDDPPVRRFGGLRTAVIRRHCEVGRAGSGQAGGHGQRLLARGFSSGAVECGLRKPVRGFRNAQPANLVRAAEVPENRARIRPGRSQPCTPGR